MLLLPFAGCVVAACTSRPDLNFSQSTPTKPSMVTGVVASAGDGRVTVNWSANDAGEGVTSYVAYSASTDFNGWNGALPDAQETSSLACCSFVRTGLTNDRPYWFSIAARNGAGIGPASPTVKALPPGWKGTQFLVTATDDRANGVARDPSTGAIYTVGSTNDVLGPEGSAGGEDGFIAKYDVRGNLVWIHQWGTANDDLFYGVAVAPGGAVFVVGATNVNTSASAVLLRFESDGSLTFAHTLLAAASATAIASGSDSTLFVALFAFATYGTLDTSPNAAGYCGDAGVGEYDTAGTLVWAHEIGSDGSCTATQALDRPNAISVDDSDGVTIAGQTNGTFTGETAAGGYDFFVARFRRSDGTFLWAHQSGSAADDVASGIAADSSGNSYVVGYTAGTLPSQTSAGGLDGVVLSRSAAGVIRWTHQFGTTAADTASAVVYDGTGMFLTGTTNSGPIGSSSSDVFVSKVDPVTGQLTWTRQRVDPSGNESSTGLCTDAAQNLFVVGERTLATSSSGDAFLSKFDASGNPL